jgi:chemosensory pili system protein ChpA (sensor histidine kinase/response regulator)
MDSLHHDLAASPADDLSALAWVHEELRRSLDATHKALQRCLKDLSAEQASDLDALDPSVLRTARQQLHQSAGALELAGLTAGATLLRASENLVQKWVARPQAMDAAAVSDIERASFALLDYIARKLAGKPVTAVALFPQYEALMARLGQGLPRPSDLWSQDWPTLALESVLTPPEAVAPRAPDAVTIDDFERGLLSLLKRNQGEDAQNLADLCGALAKDADQRRAHRECATWMLAAGFLEGLAQRHVPLGVHAKRVLSSLLSQLRQLAKGQGGPSDRLANELLFFCAQAASTPEDANASILSKVRQTFGLSRHQPVDLARSALGKHDPGVIQQAIKRVAGAKEGWSAVSGGELLRIGGLNEQFSLVGDSLNRLYPSGDVLAQALGDAVAQTVSSAQAPQPTLAMEVATAILYLEASLEDGEFDHPEQQDRVRRLAERISQTRSGAEPAPLEAWMEDLYRRVSDRQTMGSVVQELRTTLSECEKQIDQFFRQPSERHPLVPVPAQLQSMRGVLAVLGLDMAVQAAVRMREDVDHLLRDDLDIDAAGQAGVFDRLATNLGALGFLVDMMGVQPALTRHLFTFDAETGLLSPLMGREKKTRVLTPDDPVEAAVQHVHAVQRTEAQAVAEDVSQVLQQDAAPEVLEQELQRLADTPMVQDQPELAETLSLAQAQLQEADDPEALAQAKEQIELVIAEITAEPEPEPEPEAVVLAPLVPEAPAPVEATGLEEDDEMRGIFLEEAQEVVSDARSALAELQAAPDDLTAMTAVRRAFHTLKGSSRMVGLNAYGEAAWACEQLYNATLAAQVPASADLLGLSAELLDAFAGWTQDIAEGRDGQWRGQPIIDAATALRERGERLTLGESSPVSLPAGELPVLAEAPVSDAVSELLEPAVVELADTDVMALDLTSDATAAASPMEPQPEPQPEVLVLDELVLDLKELDGAPDVPVEEATTVAGELDEGASADLLDVVPEHERIVLSLEAEDVPQDASAAAASEEDALAADDEQVKVIGPLRISIPLFNIYLNEADEQSRRLSTALSEWALEPHRPVSDDMVALAHSLAGNSGTVGYTDLSQLARQLEHVLAHCQPLGQVLPDELALFNEAADEIRRLLHQFAAGFLKSPPEELMTRLAEANQAAALRLENRLLSAQAEAADGGLAPARSHLTLVHDADAVVETEPAPAMDAEFVSPAIPELTPESAPEPVPEAVPEPEPAADSSAEPVVDTAPELVDEPIQRPEPLPPQPLSAILPQAQWEDDSDIDAEDAVDLDLFPIFEEEAQELLPQLAVQARQWLDMPEHPAAATACMRTLHTFKGGARLAGAMRLGEMAHRMESAIERLLAQDSVRTEELAPLETRVDQLIEVFEALRRQQAEGVAAANDLAALPPVLEVSDDQPVESTPELTDAAVMADVPADVPAVSAPSDAPSMTPAPVDTAPVPWAKFTPSAGETVVTTAGPKDAVVAQAAVRVRPQLLDRLVNHAGEVAITRTRLQSQVEQIRGSLTDLTDNLDRLRHHLRDIELQAETEMSTKLEAARAARQDFDPLEFDRYTRFQELTRMMAESVNDVATVQRTLQRNLETAEDQLAAQARLTRDLQDDLLRTRMVEFESLSDRLYRVVRLAGKETGKQVRLDIVGGNTEVDRGVLERMVGAFEHLLRNCVTHGIEMPESRTAAGKPASGQITVSLRQEGNEVAIEVADDGAGLNLQRIRQRAERLGLVSAGDEPSDRELTQFIFTPGFSTADQVTELAGRGIGMDVVRSEVNAMGGRIETRTTAGAGTTFTLVLPLTTAVTKVVMLRCGAMSLAVPTHLIEIVRRARPTEVEQAYRTGQFALGDQILPFHWVGALLNHSPMGTESGRSLPVVVIRSAQQRIAMHVDEVLGNQEVVVKNLGPQLSRMPGLAGMTLLASGAVSLIYNPVALATVYGDSARQLTLQAVEALGPQAQWLTPGAAAAVVVPEVAEPAVAQTPSVLVVDDSLTVRKVTQRLLAREGYRVVLAKDGLEALECLAREVPAVVLSDIEMPRMDGFDLARNIRADAKLAHLPIIMITSRIAQKHREYAVQLGVNHYLGKPYSEEELLALVARYAATVTPA